MERADKIFVALSFALVIGILVHEHRPRSGDSWRTSRRIPHDQLGVPAVPGHASDHGPAYLLSALPVHRRADDFDPPVST